MSSLTRTQHEPVEERGIAAPTDAAFFWNKVLLDALLVDDQKPRERREQGGVTRASRAAAIVHAAIHDAVNGVERRFSPYLVQSRAPEGASIEAAAAAAAHATLVGLYPSQRTQGTRFDDKLDEYIKSIPASGRDKGLQFGRKVGNELLRTRQNDGSAQTDPPAPPKSTPGQWYSDLIEGPQLALTPKWGKVQPFTLNSGSQLRPGPFPSLSSRAYADAFREVRRVGRFDAPKEDRTDDQTQIARFWRYDDRFGTPVRLYNQNMREILTQRPRPAAPTGLHVHARIFALVNLAMADAGIGCWDAKFFYDLWRPIHGIRRADEDNNPNTTPDRTWKPLGRRTPPNATPPFPAYVSGHSSFGTAAFAMLRKVYGSNNVSFKLTSDELRSVRRNYNSFQKAIDENGQSRIYLGVHWQFDNTRGKTLGQQVADHIWPDFLRPVT